MGGPDLALGEEMMARLPLAATAPSALAQLPAEEPCHPLMQKRPDLGMPDSSW